jgi:GNAT superfamily N-acetyltransferase
MSITITNTQPEHFAALEALQQVCYPTLHPDEWLRAIHFASHYRLFPEGQHVALDGDRPVGMSATFRIDLDWKHPDHTFHEIIAGGYFTNHDPRGAYLYGADMSVHPDYRRRGIASQLYAARKALIRRLNLRGMVAGGMIPGYRHYRERMSVDEYVRLVQADEIADPTLTPQLRNGFVVRGILRDYIHDDTLGHDATLIVWNNPDYKGVTSDE